MTTKVLLFASLREIASGPSLTLDLPQGATAGDLVRVVAGHLPAAASLLPRVRVAVNQAYVGMDHEIAPGDEVALIPPVSGG